MCVTERACDDRYVNSRSDKFVLGECGDKTFVMTKGFVIDASAR